MPARVWSGLNHFRWLTASVPNEPDTLRPTPNVENCCVYHQRNGRMSNFVTKSAGRESRRWNVAKHPMVLCIIAVLGTACVCRLAVCSAPVHSPPAVFTTMLAHRSSYKASIRNHLKALGRAFSVWNLKHEALRIYHSCCCRATCNGVRVTVAKHRTQLEQMEKK